MTQDTRKDRRVKIVSLNVRYKSATVDEFIENHAHDVSRGGIFIKTTSPFAGGTLLKFEIRLASDQAVIAGVGRVVWKRDASTATAEHPAGMGVKFIKVDEPSKAVIDRLIHTRTDAGKSFEEEGETALVAPQAGSEPPAEAPAAAHTTAGLGLGASRSSAPPPGNPSATTRSSPPRPQKAVMFPQGEFEKETYPKQEQTVMKQAAELLEEALREAGGSMEEVGTNPLFSGTGSAARILASPAVSAGEDKAGAALPEAREGAGGRSEKGSKADMEDAANHAKAMLSGMSPAATKRPSESPPPASASARRKTSRSEARSPASDRRAPAAPRNSKSAPAKAANKQPVPKMAILVGAGLAVVLALFFFRDTLFGGGTDKATVTPEPTAATAVTPVLPTPSAAAAASTTTSPVVTAATPAATESASPPATTSTPPSAPSIVATSEPRAVAPPRPALPAPARAAIAPSVATPTASAPAPAPPGSVSAELPAGGAPQTTATPPHPAPPHPPPRATPTPKPTDDNPY